MKDLIVVPVACFCLLFAVAPGLCASLDASDGGMEVIGPSTVIMHNVFVGSAFYYVAFQWHPFLNVWYPIAYGLEDPAFSAGEYYPLEEGDTWTYQLSSGGTLTLTVNGTEEICGLTCIRFEASDGSTTYWISDESGIFMSRFIFDDGTYITWCPPMKIVPAHLYLGTQSLTVFTDAPYRLGNDIQVGSQSGWSSFVVKGSEDVTVPAGTFAGCFRSTFAYTYTETWSGAVGMRIEEAWYAQDVGIVKRINIEAASHGGTVFRTSFEGYSLQSSSRVD